MFPISDNDIKRRSFPYVNIGIMIVCALVFFYELTLSGLDTDIFFLKYGLISNELTNGVDFTWFSAQGPLTGDQLAGQNTAQLEAFGYIVNIDSPIPNWMTIFTSMFIHGDWMHFLGNMLFLWVFGDNIEDRFGHFGYLIFYLAAGVVACWFQIAVDTQSVTPTIGASGAIAGVLGAYFLLYPFSRITTLVWMIFIIPIMVPAYLLLGFWIFLQFIPGIAELGASTHSGGVAYWAHIGGFLAGMTVVAVYKLRRHEPLWPGGGRGYGGGGYGGGQDETKYWRGRPIDY